VSESTSDSKDEVEEEVLDVPKSVLNVVSKNEKENHVPEDVQDVAVKEH